MRRVPARASGARRSGALADETQHRQAQFEGSFRQRRGIVMARLRAGRCRADELDGEALASLLDDGLAEVTRRPRATYPLTLARVRVRTTCRGSCAEQVVAGVGEDRLGVELHAFDRELAVAQRPSPSRLRTRR